MPRGLVAPFWDFDLYTRVYLQDGRDALSRRILSQWKNSHSFKYVHLQNWKISQLHERPAVGSGSFKEIFGPRRSPVSAELFVSAAAWEGTIDWDAGCVSNRVFKINDLVTKTFNFAILTQDPYI